jgi:hypothetical protein
MKLIEPQFKPAEFCRTVYQVTPEPGTAAADLLKPEFWTHVAGKLRQGDRIEAVPADGVWFAEYYVKAANKIEAHLVMMREVTLSKAVPKPAEKPDYECKHVGGGRWRVLRTKDNAELETGFKSKEAAQEWLDGYLKDVAA